MSEKEHDHAGVIAPPPLIYFGTLAVGLITNFFAPITFLPGGINVTLGELCIVLGLGIAFSAFITMHRAGTPPDPGEPVRALVVGGPFRFTRNPIYIALALIYLGVTCIFNTLIALALLPIALATIHIGVIRREEKYLEIKFGDEYLQYKERVRRWI